MDEHPHPIPCTKYNTKSQQGTAPSAANPTMGCPQLMFAVLSSCPLMPPLAPINAGFQLQVIDLQSQLASPEFFLFFSVPALPISDYGGSYLLSSCSETQEAVSVRKKEERRKGTFLDLHPDYGLETHCRLPLLQACKTAIDPKTASVPTGSAGTAYR